MRWCFWFIDKTNHIKELVVILAYPFGGLLPKKKMKGLNTSFGSNIANFFGLTKF